MISTSTPKRKCSSSDQVHQSKRMALDLPDRACCNCSNTIKVFDYRPPNLPFCIDCSHKLCLDCPIQSPLLETLSVYEESRAQELQPQPTGSQKEVETGVTSRRSLNMNKCERCRLDKKKCLPVDRVWPTKCDLCIKKGFSCSESKRVVRSTKHAPATTPSPMNTISPSTTSASFEERLKQWCFLLSYRKMIMAAKDRLGKLERSLFFLFPSLSHVTKRTRSDSYSQFSLFIEHSLAAVLSKHATELFTLEPASQNLPGWFLTTHLNQYGLEADNNFACSECFPTRSRSSASGLENVQDTCGELLLLQHRVLCLDNDDGSEHWEALVRLAHEVRKRASEIFESHGFHESAKWVNIYGVYHPEEVLYCLPGYTEDFFDCLERSWLHMRMDDGEYFDNRELFGSSLGVSILKDRRDILGRTALIIACQEEWNETVGWLLEEEADPGLTTIYGSLPLHYAAAKGLINICKQLLAHKTRFDIRAKDCVGKTALDYAREKKHQGVVDLLSVEYAAADGEDEELIRSLQAGIESDGVQGSYLV